MSDIRHARHLGTGIVSAVSTIMKLIKPAWLGVRRRTAIDWNATPSLLCVTVINSFLSSDRRRYIGVSPKRSLFLIVEMLRMLVPIDAHTAFDRWNSYVLAIVPAAMAMLQLCPDTRQAPRRVCLVTRQLSNCLLICGMLQKPDSTSSLGNSRSTDMPADLWACEPLQHWRLRCLPFYAHSL